MKVDLTDKVVFITGSSKGIGKEIAKAFAREHALVVLNYYSSEKAARSLYNEIKEMASDSLLIRGDVSKSKDVCDMFEKIVNRFGRIDILINNAGICDDSLLQFMSFQQWHRVIDVNLTGTYLCCQAAANIMINQCYGKIINISSLKGQEGSEKQINYSASKAGVLGLTKSLAKELGCHNISVNAICPGFVTTDLNRNNANKIERARERSVLSMNSTLTDLVNFVLYISSDKFNGISGQVFNLDSRL